MNTLEGKAWQALSAARGIGPRGLWRIAEYLAGQGRTAAELLGDPDEIKKFLPANAVAAVRSDFFKEDNAVNIPEGKNPPTVLHPLHRAFPERIRFLKDRVTLPALLYALGNVAVLNRPAIAIVGKRNPTAAALAATGSLAAEFASLGIAVTSGHAPGTDRAAHRAALRAGGATTFVLAEGIRRFTPRPEMKGLLTTENSLAISQFEPEARWTAYMAMNRNKLVGALSDALVVIVSGPERDEDGRNSGTFNAAMAALKTGIPVFVATPGSFAEAAPGNRELIKRGCREWEPAAGAAPIHAAARASAGARKKPLQLHLFDPEEH